MPVGGEEGKKGRKNIRLEVGGFSTVLRPLMM